MSSKKSGKKKRSRGPKTEGTSAEQVVFGLLSELLSRGVEHGAYKWCLQKNADPKRTVFVSCVPAEMPNGVICAIMARTLNRGLVEIVDAVKSADSVYQSLLVQAEGNIDSEACQTLIRCEDCPLGYWIMIMPLEDSNIGLATAEVDPPSVNKEPPPWPKVSTDKMFSKDPAVLTKGPPAVKKLLEKKVFCSAEESPPKGSLQSAMAPSKEAKMLPGAMEPLQVREPPLVGKQPPLQATSTTKELSLLEKGLPSMRKPSSATKMPLVCQHLPPPFKVLPAAKLLPAVKELSPETNALPLEKEEKRLNVLIPSVIKIILPANDSLPSAKVSSPIKGMQMINKSDKNHQTVQNETDSLVKLPTREHFDTVVPNPSPIINYGTQGRIKFPVTKLPNATYDPVWGGVSMERQKKKRRY